VSVSSLLRSFLVRFVDSSIAKPRSGNPCTLLMRKPIVVLCLMKFFSHSYFTVTADGPLHNELGEEEKSLQLFGEC
jgi:hypothetical protein